MVDELATAIGVDLVRVALLDQRKNELTIVAEHTNLAKAAPIIGTQLPIKGNGIVEALMQTKQMVFIEDAQHNPMTKAVHELFRKQGIETLIMIPMLVNDEVIGTVGMDILDKRPVPYANLQLAETIVRQTATAIQNARLFEQSEKTALPLKSVVRKLP